MVQAESLTRLKSCYHTGKRRTSEAKPISLVDESAASLTRARGGPRPPERLDMWMRKWCPSDHLLFFVVYVVRHFWCFGVLCLMFSLHTSSDILID